MKPEENTEEKKENPVKKTSGIGEATQKDWDDFFLSQEAKPAFIFDR